MSLCEGTRNLPAYLDVEEVICSFVGAVNRPHFFAFTQKVRSYL